MCKLNHTESSVTSSELSSKPFIVIRTACPVDVTISYGNETITSPPEIFSNSASFGRIDVLGESDDIKMLCLDNLPDFSIVLNGTNAGTMNYDIRFFSGDDEI